MDNIIVNSALWYAEQSSQFLLNSGANKLLDKGYDYYVKEIYSAWAPPYPKRSDCRRCDGWGTCRTIFDGIRRKLLACSKNRVQFRFGISQNIGRD